MKKVYKTLACIFVVLIGVNSFAAIVSDNDGSAFVTKGEFDALKVGFNSQIEQYNKSINDKIDGAIASYLSGLAVQSVPLFYINNDWKECVEIEGNVIENKYDYPLRNLFFGFEGGNFGNNWHTSWGLVASAQDNVANSDQTRIMCDAGTDPKSDAWPTYVTWEGVAKDFKETINWSRLGNRFTNAKSGVDYWNGAGLNKYEYTITNGTSWVDGYSAADDARWQPTGNKYNSSYSGSSGNLVPQPPEWYIQNNEIEYNENNLNYKHIIVYDKIASVSVTDKDWTLHVNNKNGDDDVKWCTDAYDAGSVKGRVAAVEQDGAASGGVGTLDSANVIYNKTITTFYAGADHGTTTSDYLRPHVGLSRGKYEYDKIKQQDKQIIVKNDKGKEVKGAERDVLDTGLATFALVKESKVTWNFKVHNTILNPLSATPTTYIGKYKVYLVLGGFDSGIVPISGSLIMNGTDDHWVTDDSGACKITFDATDEGVLYVKWVPYEGTPTNWASTFVFGENPASYVME